MNPSRVEVAKIGKVVGLDGSLKLHLQSDFIEQFQAGARFFLKDNASLTISSYHDTRGLVKFEGYHVREEAAKLTNQILYISEEASREQCKLASHEHFWFDIIGAKVLDDGKVLGVVSDIERIATVDYIKVKTAADLVKEEYPKLFYIPYIVGVYIDRFDEESKVLYTQDAFGLLEAS